MTSDTSIQHMLMQVWSLFLIRDISLLLQQATGGTVSKVRQVWFGSFIIFSNLKNTDTARAKDIPQW